MLVCIRDLFRWVHLLLLVGLYHRSPRNARLLITIFIKRLLMFRIYWRLLRRVCPTSSWWRPQLLFVSQIFTIGWILYTNRRANFKLISWLETLLLINWLLFRQLAFYIWWTILNIVAMILWQYWAQILRNWTFCHSLLQS